jgi:hypothetical protein
MCSAALLNLCDKLLDLDAAELTMSGANSKISALTLLKVTRKFTSPTTILP